MQVLLIQPPCIVSERFSDRVLPFLPIGLGSLAAVLRDSGHRVIILDALTEGWEQRGRIEENWIEIGLSEEDIAAAVRRIRPQVVGFSVPFTTQMPRLRSLARWIKAIHPEIFVVCGGNHPTSSPGEILEIPEVDVVILGEGEQTFPLLLTQLAGGKGFDQLNGIAYRKDSGGTAIHSATGYIDDLDLLPMPAYDLLPLKKFFKAIGKRSMPLFTSRGCANACSYCSSPGIFGRKTRFKSADYLIKQMRHLTEFYGVHEFLFDDDTLFSNRELADQLFNRIFSENLKIQWIGRNGVDPKHLDDELLAKMKQSGGKRLHFAPDSGSRRVLYRILGKSLNLYELERAIIRSLTAGFKVSCHFTIGIPGETLEEVYETLNFAWKLRSFGVDEFHFSLAIPFVGTDLRTRAEQMDCILPQPEPMFIPQECCLSNHDISAAEITKIRDSAEREFNSRGLVVGLSQRVVSRRRAPQVQEERFFDSVAPAPHGRRVPEEPSTHHEMAEETV